MSALRSSCSCSSRMRCVLNFHFWNVRCDSNSSFFGSVTSPLSVLHWNSCSARFSGLLASCFASSSARSLLWTYDCQIHDYVVGSASTMTSSATTSNACQQSSRAMILARDLARALARAVARTRTTLAKASRKAVAKANTRAKVDEEEVLPASKIGITRTRTSPEAT